MGEFWVSFHISVLFVLLLSSLAANEVGQTKDMFTLQSASNKHSNKQSYNSVGELCGGSVCNNSAQEALICRWRRVPDGHNPLLLNPTRATTNPSIPSVLTPPCLNRLQLYRD